MKDPALVDLLRRVHPVTSRWVRVEPLLFLGLFGIRDPPDNVDGHGLADVQHQSWDVEWSRGIAVFPTPDVPE